MNSRNIPSSLESEVRNRDKNCIYCGIQFNKKQRKTQQLGSIL